MSDYNLQYQDTYIDALLATVNELKSNGYIFKGVATPTTNPGTTTEKCAYIASEAGTYTNFGNLSVTDLSILIYNGSSWSKNALNVLGIKQTIGESTTSVMSQKAVTDELTYTTENINLSSYSAIACRLTSAFQWTAYVYQSTNKHIWIPCRAGDVFRLTGGSSSVNYAFMKSDNHPTSGSTAVNANVCDGYASMPVITANEVQVVTAPSDANGLCINHTVNGNNVLPSKVEKLEYMKNHINKIDTEIAAINGDIYQVTDALEVRYYGVGRVVAADGTITGTGYGYSYYMPIWGAKQIYVLGPTIQSNTYGLAFYSRPADGNDIASVYISGVTYSESSTGSSMWRLIDVPDGANYFRTILYLNTPSQYKLVANGDELMGYYKDACAEVMATQIFRDAKPVSSESFLYAFGISQMAIVGHKAYIRYASNENSVDGDTLNNTNVYAMSIVDLFDMSSEIVYPTTGTTKYNDGTTATPDAIQYSTYCATPNGNIATLALMRFNNNNPYYCFAINAPDVTTMNYKTCLLAYTANGTSHSVDFTKNNYRQMLVDMGYADSYVASTSDGVDNINIHYDKTESIYYAVFCASKNSSESLPLVLMQSSDMETWSPKAYLGKKNDANEIAAIYMSGIAYVCYRTFSHGMNYLVYDVANSVELSSGVFPVSKDLLSKPDCFSFDNSVFMAVNVDPSVYLRAQNYNRFYLDSRQEINIYRLIGGTPKFFRKVNNPTGLQYYSFMETPPMYATAQSTSPMWQQGAIYVAFSEDRRHLYRRQIAQVSFADVTALFAEFGRIV